jgi:pimeloyl-ACP methyl ester carboxylesterase
MTVKRAFADIAEGQIHYWHGQPSSMTEAHPPLMYLHPGPGTARHQVPLLNTFAKATRVIAPDMLGMGDSAPAREDVAMPGLDYFADAAWRFLDSLGVRQCYLMGSSLGGRTAVEMARQQPQRVKGLVLNRILMIAGEDLTEMKAKHAPEVKPDQTGQYVWFVWTRMRSLITYFPWFKTDAAHMRKVDLPSAEQMHISFVEHIKMCATSHKAFTAYWHYPIADKLAGLSVPVMCRPDTASFIPGATTWVPPFEGDILGAKEDQLAALAAPVLDYMGVKRGSNTPL